MLDPRPYRLPPRTLAPLSDQAVEVWVRPRPHDGKYPVAVVAYVPAHLTHLVPGLLLDKRGGHLTLVE